VIDTTVTITSILIIL